MKKNNTLSRREFLAVSATAGVAGAIGLPALMTSCKSGAKLTPLKAPGSYYLPTLTDKAIDGKPLKAGVVGCGGRGRGAVQNLLDAAGGVEIVALGDMFPEQIERVNKALKKKYDFEVPADRCFSGFDAYQKVIDSGVDLVLLCTPPAFRPEHFSYATAKGVHAFLEKPIAVDSDGYRSVMATAKQARAKNLSVVTGTQRHHQRAYIESYKQIMNGLIGEITGGAVYWNQGELWHKKPQREWSDMEAMLRDWVNWRWLSGDHIVEQHLHNIDVFTWFSGLKPLKAIGFGGRQRRPTGDQYDHFSVDFEFENGVHLHSMCRQIHDCDRLVAEFVQGTKGSWSGSQGGEHVIKDLEGNVLWSYDPKDEKKPEGPDAAPDPNRTYFEQNNPYVLEHVNWVTHIRRGDPINQVEETALSNMAAIMGRESAYTGKTATWDNVSAMSMNLLPAELKFCTMDMKPKIPVCGSPKPAEEAKKKA